MMHSGMISLSIRLARLSFLVKYNSDFHTPDLSELSKTSYTACASSSCFRGEAQLSRQGNQEAAQQHLEHRSSAGSIMAQVELEGSSGGIVSMARITLTALMYGHPRE